MLRFLASSAFALVLATSCVAPAVAQTASSFSVLDATKTTRSLCETLDGSGNLTSCMPVGSATSALQSSVGATAHSDAQAIAANTKPVTSFVPVTIGTAFTPGLGLAAVCTAAGSVVLAGSDGSQITVPVGVGFNQFGFAVAKVVSETATCTFTALS